MRSRKKEWIKYKTKSGQPNKACFDDGCFNISMKRIDRSHYQFGPTQVKNLIKWGAYDFTLWTKNKDIVPHVDLDSGVITISGLPPLPGPPPPTRKEQLAELADWLDKMADTVQDQEHKKEHRAWAARLRALFKINNQ